MAPFTPTGNPQRRNLYGDGNDSYGQSGSNSYSTGKGSYSSGDGKKNVYSDSAGKYGVGDAGKNSYMTGVSKIAPEKPSPDSWTKVHKSSFPRGSIMRSSAPKNTDGGTGNGYAEKDTSSLYYTGGASYQKGSRSSAPTRSAPKRKAEVNIPMPASFSLGSILMDESPGYAMGGSVGTSYGMSPSSRMMGAPVAPSVPMSGGPQQIPDHRMMGKGVGDRWRDTFERPERDYSTSAPFMSRMTRQPMQPQPALRPAMPPAGGYPPPPAGMMPQPVPQASTGAVAPANRIPMPAFQQRRWGGWGGR